MSNRLYTNTSNVGAMIGLFVTTVALSYATTHSTEIVNETVKAVKNGFRAVTDVTRKVAHDGKNEYAEIAKDSKGRYYDTGKRVWR